MFDAHKAPFGSIWPTDSEPMCQGAKVQGRNEVGSKLARSTIAHSRCIDNLNGCACHLSKAGCRLKADQRDFQELQQKATIVWGNKNA